jgi:hypothetical protein
MAAGKQAGGASKKSLERGRDALRLPLVPLLLRELAAEQALDACLRAVEGQVGKRAFEDAADDLRARAARAAVALGSPLIETQLEHAGYDTDEIDEIRQHVDVFHYQNAKLLLLAALLSKALEESAGGGKATGRALMKVPAGTPEAMPEIELIPAEVEGALGRCFAEGREHARSGSVPDDFRALGRWPKYLMTAWADAKRRWADPRAAAALKELAAQVEEAVSSLPGSASISDEDLVSAGADPKRVRALLQRHAAALARLALDLAIFKVQLDGAEDAVDSPYPVDWEYLSSDDYMPPDADEEVHLRAGDPTSLDDVETPRSGR